MVKMIHRLTATKFVEAGLYGDGGGLYLQVTQGVHGPAKSWLFRYRFEGKRRDMGLGSARTFTLADARERARQCRQQVESDVDPIATRDAERERRAIERAKRITFRICAERYIGAHKASWKNEKHIAQWSATIATYVNPVVGDLPVQEVDTALVMKVLDPIWTTKTETASRVRGRIESILDWARVRGFRRGENPARWRGHLEVLLAKRSKVREVKHHTALPYAELPEFMRQLREERGSAARALEFLILTAARTTEVLEAVPTEFKGAIWIVPPNRMKGRKEHRVPFSTRAREIVDEMRRSSNSAFVFPGWKKNGPLSNMALPNLLERMKRPELTAHGFRSTFKDWASECTNHPLELSEMALAHTIDSKVEAAYRRGDLFAKRVSLMEEWDAYCGGKAINQPGLARHVAAVAENTMGPMA